jgi:hypothetical protein
MTVKIRFDDQCKNGHNSFSMTAEIVTNESKRQGDIAAGGCLHEEIEKIFPELAHLIKWHSSSTDGPMHYPGNVLYLAGDTDHRGKKAGETYAWDDVIYFSDSPVGHKISAKFADFLKSRMLQKNSYFYCDAPTGEFEMLTIHHKNKPGDYAYSPRYTFAGFGEEWAICPFKDESTALEWVRAINSGLPVRFAKTPTLLSDGKKRELDAARNCAVWPEATDEELCKPEEELRAILEARLPGLLVAMRADIEAAGFVWGCQQ